MEGTLDLSNLGFALTHSWLIPAFPFFSFILLGLFGQFVGDKISGMLATLSIMCSAFFATMLGLEYFQMFEPGQATPFVAWSFEWLRYQTHLTVNAGVFVDSISVLLMFVVSVVSSLVHLYSIGYMSGDEGYRRYFVFLNFFTFSMLGLVVAPNILQMFVCWELVGASSFLLIGFYYQKASAVAASKKAFIVTRFADLGFLVGMMILGYCGYNAYAELAPAVNASSTIASGLAIEPFDFLFINHADVLAATAAAGSFAGLNLLTWALILVFIGAAGKSAMFPLHIWLPDAMEGPTPVSSLIHAATMVVAGVYLVARLFPAYAFSGDALMVVMSIGAFTCLFAAVIGCNQDDIKRVLAFSTLSQLGYMMFALGVGTMDSSLGYTASMFHLFTHAFFKCLLFLGAGAVIHAVHSNMIWDMGGLRKKMPVTHLLFLIACLAIAGVPPLAGFFSKDEILAAALHNHHTVVYFVGLLVAGITPFYMFRIYFVTFWGEHRSDAASHAHEAPFIMLLPMSILAIGAVVAGFVPIPYYVTIGAPLAHHGIDWAVAAPATGVGLIGIFLAWFMYCGNADRADKVAKMLGFIYTAVKNKFYFDEIYLFITKKIIFNYISRPISWFDRNVVDGGVNLSGWITRTTGAVLALLHTGQVQTYAVWMVSGFIFVAITVWAWVIVV